MQCIDVAIAVVVNQRKVLICRRKSGGVLGGYWEFPGGKREPGETLRDCLARELREEVGIEITILRELTPVQHDYKHASVRLHPFLCRHVSGEPAALECERLEWVDAGRFCDYEFPPANDSLLREIAGAIGDGQ